MTSRSPDLAVIDTSVYVDNVRSGRFEADLLALPYLVRVSAVVVAELARGAQSRQARQFTAHMIKNFSLLAPTDADWTRSGRIVRALADRHGFDIHKLREIHFDVLIALTARRVGAHLITANAKDYLAIQKVLTFKLICW
jgi:predicted nucleic acid-binding protein